MIKDNRGNAAILSVAICLAVILVMCAAFEYLQLLIISNGIENAVQTAVVSLVTANYDEVYSQLREGYSGGYKYTDTGFEECIDTENVMGRLDELLALANEGDKHTKYKSRTDIEYSISDLRIEFENTEIAQGNTDKNLNAVIYVDVEIPVRYGGRSLVPVRYTQRVKAEYMPKF